MKNKLKELSKWLDDLDKNDNSLISIDIEWLNTFPVRAIFTIIIAFIIIFVLAVAIPFIIIMYYINKLCKCRFKFVTKSRATEILKEFEGLTLNNNHKYYLKGYVHKNDTTFNLFLYTFFKILNEEYRTFNTQDRMICSSHRRRSLGDIYLICKYYYPNITLLEVLKEIKSLLDKKIISGNRCGTINKFVYFISQEKNSLSNDTVEYGEDLIFSDIIKAVK